MWHRGLINMNIENIEKFYEDNIEYYERLKTLISSKINGRIPHHKVVVLNILVMLSEVSKYLEIGVHNGASMSYVVNQDSQKIECFGLDLFQSAKYINNRDSVKYMSDNISKEKSYSNIQNNNKSESKITLIEGNSQDKKVIKRLENLELDLLFIDGDHSYSGVKNDFNNYSPIVKSGGLIVVDDYATHDRRYEGVVTFCNKEINEKEFSRIGVFMDNELILRKI